MLENTWIRPQGEFRLSKANFIWDKQQCLDAYDELMVKIAMSSYAEIEGQKLLEKNEHLKASHRDTSQIEKNIRRIVRKELLRSSARDFGKRFYSAASKVSIIFLAIFITFSFTMVASASFRSIIYRLVFTHEPRYTLIEIYNGPEFEFVGTEAYTWDNAFAPTVMPQGYTVSDVMVFMGSAIVTYTNDSGGYIYFIQNYGYAGGTLLVDTERAQVVQPVLINGSEGLAVSKDGVNSVVWRIGNVILHLESNENLDVLIEIARGVRLLQ